MIKYNEATDLLNRRSVRLAVKLSNLARSIRNHRKSDSILLASRNTHYPPFSDPVRTWSNVELRKFSSLLSGDIVNVSGWEDKDKDGDFYSNYFPQASSYTITNYSQHMLDKDNEITLDLELDLRKELVQRFDVVFNHTILEHIFEVRKAYHNLASMSRDIVITVVPFIQQQHEHETFMDYWRFTPTTLRRMAEENGLHIIYENYRRDPYEITYIISVASRDPDKWESIFPTYEKLNEIASWIG